jgi:hypothetical protein
MRHDVEGAPDWLAEARDALVREGDYLAFEDGDEISIGRFSLFFVSLVGEREDAATSATAG